MSAQKLIEPLLAPSIKQRGFGEVQILTRWKEIVGPKLAAHCRPLHIQGGRGKQAEAALVVAVNPAFATDLQHQYPQIIERISTFCGAKLVSRLQLVQTPMAGTQTNEKLTMPGFPPLKPAPARASETTDETDPLEAALASLAKALQEKRRMA